MLTLALLFGDGCSTDATSPPNTAASGTSGGPSTINAPGTATDAVQSNDDVDKGCQKDDDCSSHACSYKKRCVAAPSCVGHAGGDTCGPGETGAADAKHESCCAVVQASKVKIAKYLITAGRMRAFVEKFQGDLQQWAATSPNGWDPTLTAQLPGSMDDASFMLGDNQKRGCSVQNIGGRTYWIDRATDPSDFSKDVLDEKPLNCVPWVLAQALCHYDGGRLATTAEIFEQITNDSKTKFPWGDSPAYVPDQEQDTIVHHYSYATPNPPATLRRDSDDFALDRTFYMAPPGRRPAGNNQIGVADAVGNMLVWVDDKPNLYAQTASWEDHVLAGFKADSETKKPTYVWGAKPKPGEGDISFGYYAIGGRCAFD